MPCRVEEYVRADGSVHFRKWFDARPADAAAKVAVATTRLSLGNTSSVKWFSGIGEYWIDWGPGYRVYLAKDGEAPIVLYGGGTKKASQSIERALALHGEYKPERRRQDRTRSGRRRGNSTPWH